MTSINNSQFMGNEDNLEPIDVEIVETSAEIQPLESAEIQLQETDTSSQAKNHIVAEAIGAAGGGIAGAAIGKMVGGRLGAAVGAVGGAIAGAAIGNQAAEGIDQKVDSAVHTMKDAVEGVTHQVEGVVETVKEKVNEADL
ncbi:MAG TPA: glycine zipper domain-containing protein, partial [Allocoleopsis sp.]